MVKGLKRKEPNLLLVVAFDVDGTLIHDLDNSPRYEVIDLFHKFEALGCSMIIWSGGGIDYAERWAEKLGLLAKVVAKGSISADLVFDDLKTALGKVDINV